jgi:porphobilinogen synthase
MNERPRRLRAHTSVRDLVGETQISLTQLIQPYFVTPRAVESEPIAGFGDVVRWGEDALLRRIEKDLESGLKHFLLFGQASEKDARGSESLDAESSVPRALRRIRSSFGNAPVLFTDVCLCPFTSHGHCGVWDGKNVSNDSSVALLAQSALVHAQSGADFVAPSDMMDGRVGAIRELLDKSGFEGTGILAYTAKYASSYYGPFRAALDSAPEAGSDRSGYQMDFRNQRDAMRELRLDISEGADMVMVKPALAYLDIISAFKQNSDVPVVAYSVSGEYQQVKLMAQAGLADERRLALENLTAIRRAGASAIITYFASSIAEKGWLR